MYIYIYRIVKLNLSKENKLALFCYKRFFLSNHLLELLALTLKGTPY